MTYTLTEEEYNILQHKGNEDFIKYKVLLAERISRILDNYYDKSPNLMIDLKAALYFKEKEPLHS